MNIAIFGAGIAGLMAAITLTASGHRCRIYERSRQNQENGMGVIVQPGAKDVFEQYGIHFGEHSSGASLHHYCHHNAEGNILHDQAMPDGSIGIRRRDLIADMMAALPPDTLTFYTSLENFEFDPAHQVTAACLTSGERVTADLYIAADGIRSLARRSLFPNWPLPQAQVLELVGLVSCKNVAHWAACNLHKFHDPNGGIAFGILPVGDDQVVWYLQFDSKRFPPPAENATARHVFAEQLVGAWGAPIPELLAATDFSRIHVWRPADAELVPTFHRQNLVLIGDAAHPLLPFTSQGVSSSIADAVALSEAMKAEDDMRAALTSYSIERRAMCAQFVQKGRDLTQRFLAPQVLSDDLLPIAK